MLRKLQAPTAITDTNPFNVFRPRERINRPQTRRRRENNQESWEKLLLMKHNLTKAKEITELMAKRERKKRDAVVGSVQWRTRLTRAHHASSHGCWVAIPHA